MDFLIFAAVLVGGVALLLLFLRLTSTRGPKTPVVLVGTASGRAEMEVWMAALRSAGIWANVHNVGDFGWYGSNPNAYEVWVREKDAEAARQVLGF